MNYKYYTKFWVKFKKKELITSQEQSIYEIDWGKLSSCIRVAIFDVDDTVGEHEGDINIKTIELFSSLVKKGIRIVLMSNCPKKREQFLRKKFNQFEAYILVKMDKPNPYIYDKIFSEMRLSASECIMVGDRVATDLYGAFLAKIPIRILVKPYSNLYEGKKAGIVYRIMRRIENWFSTNTL